MTDKALIANWIVALRSGYYKQVQSKLYDECADGYCCLGVLCKVAGANFEDFDTGEEDVWDDSTIKWENRPIKDGANLALNDDELLDPDFMESIGIPDNIASHLVDMNDGNIWDETLGDTKKYTFLEIADYIEKEFLLKND
jgi:hypothetical protein